MAASPNEDTEFNDALRKYGIIPPRDPSPVLSSPPNSPTFEDLLNDFTPSELRELSESSLNDKKEILVATHRLRRLMEERREVEKARFGRVYPISRDDYTREVTEASRLNEEDDKDFTGTGVICFLYKDGISRCDHALRHVHSLASRYPRTKFVSIIGDKCIPNLPDSRIPMFIVYKKGEIRNQIVAWGVEKEKNLEELETILAATGVLYSLGHSSSPDPDKNCFTDGRNDDSGSEFEFDL